VKMVDPKPNAAELMAEIEKLLKASPDEQEAAYAEFANEHGAEVAAKVRELLWPKPELSARPSAKARTGEGLETRLQSHRSRTEASANPRATETSTEGRSGTEEGCRQAKVWLGRSCDAQSRERDRSSDLCSRPGRSDRRLDRCWRQKAQQSDGPWRCSWSCWNADRQKS